jgi:hypothetical protein
MKKYFATLCLIVFLLLVSASAALADEEIGDDFYPWKHHEAPFDFKFGAMIDSHQQSKVNSAGILQGFIYIQRTGVYNDEGYPIAEKAHCSTGTCSLGWVIKGVPVQATLVHVAPRVWLVDPADLPDEPGYSHFQWVGTPKTPHELVVGNTYDGYLLKRVAPEPFYWLGGGGGSGGSGGTGGCSGHDGGDTGDTGGCTDHDGGDTGDTGGCTDHDSGDTGDTGGCTDHDSGDTGDTGGCSGHDGGDTGSSGHSGGSDGRLVGEGVDSHSNIVTVWDGTWSGGCGGHDGSDPGGCGDDSGCTGH